jgi:hypothetical protein
MQAIPLPVSKSQRYVLAQFVVLEYGHLVGQDLRRSLTASKETGQTL